MCWWADPENAKHAWDFGIAAIGAFAGTLAGAWVAVRGDRERRKQETQDRHVEAANVAIFSLSLIYTYAVEYHMRIIEPVKNDPGRWYPISRAMLPPPLLAPFDVGRLAFLFEGPNKSVPNRLAIEFVRFAGLLEVIRRAGEANQELHRICAAKNPVPRGLAEIEEAIGVLIKNVDDIVGLAEGLAPSAREAALELRAAMLSIYPQRTIVQFAPELQKIP